LRSRGSSWVSESCLSRCSRRLGDSAGPGRNRSRRRRRGRPRPVPRPTQSIRRRGVGGRGTLGRPVPRPAPERQWPGSPFTADRRRLSLVIGVFALEQGGLVRHGTSRAPDSIPASRSWEQADRLPGAAASASGAARASLQGLLHRERGRPRRIAAQTDQNGNGTCIADLAVLQPEVLAEINALTFSIIDDLVGFCRRRARALVVGTARSAMHVPFPILVRLSPRSAAVAPFPDEADPAAEALAAPDADAAAPAIDPPAPALDAGIESGAREVPGRTIPCSSAKTADNEAQAAPIRVNGEPATAVQAQAEEPGAESSSSADTSPPKSTWVGTRDRRGRPRRRRRERFLPGPRRIPLTCASICSSSSR